MKKIVYESPAIGGASDEQVKKVVNSVALSSYLTWGIESLDPKLKLNEREAIEAFTELLEGGDTKYPKERIISVLEAIYNDEKSDEEDGILGEEPSEMAAFLGLPGKDFKYLKQYVLSAIQKAIEIVSSKTTKSEASLGSGMTWDELYMSLVKKTQDTDQADEMFGKLTQDYPDYKWKDEVPSEVFSKISGKKGREQF